MKLFFIQKIQLFLVMLFDAQCTKIMEVDGKQLVKVITWYDNEMSYTAQMVRTAKYLVEHFK